MERVIVYTCDYCGKYFYGTEDCLKHEQHHRNIEGANKMLWNGATLKQINQRYFLWDNLPEYLENVTKDNCFEISYWQCCKKPAYQIKSICFDGRFCIGGIGSWSGYYENYMRIDNINLKKVYQPEELYIYKYYL